MYDDVFEYGVGYFEDYKLDGPGIKYFYSKVKEGIFENDVLIEEKSLGLQSYSHLSKSSKAITSTLF